MGILLAIEAGDVRCLDLDGARFRAAVELYLKAGRDKNAVVGKVALPTFQGFEDVLGTQDRAVVERAAEQQLHLRQAHLRESVYILAAQGIHAVVEKRLEDLWDAFRLLSSHALATAPEPEMPVYADTNPAENVPINVPIKSLNERQRWFLILLKRKNKARAEDIAVHFGVALKTAKRDIEGLKDAGKIRFVGARKTGRYELTQP